MERYLGLDYGCSKIGLAVSDSETKIAFAYSTIDNDRFFLDTLGKIVELEKIDKIIVGKLKIIKDQRRSFDAFKIGEVIKKQLKTKVEYQEEMFSTKMAQSNLKEKGARRIKDLDNQEAARIILQSWLDKK